MQWVTEWGPRIRKLVEIEQASGITPKALQDAPACIGFDRELILCYNFLASRRSAGLVVNPIPLSEIEAYIRLFGEPALPMDIFVNMLGVMDMAYLEKVNGNKSSS